MGVTLTKCQYRKRAYTYIYSSTKYYQFIRIKQFPSCLFFFSYLCERINNNTKRMKKIFFSLLCLFSLAAWSQTMTEWDNVSITSLNRVQSHDLSIPFDNAEEATSLDLTKSPYFLDLNGTWKFRWNALPSKVPSGFYADNYDVSS